MRSTPGRNRRAASPARDREPPCFLFRAIAIAWLMSTVICIMISLMAREVLTGEALPFVVGLALLFAMVLWNVSAHGPGRPEWSDMSIEAALNHRKKRKHRHSFELMCPALPYVEQERAEGELEEVQDVEFGPTESYSAHEICCVCLQPKLGGQLCRSMPCGHSFHMECIDGWRLQLAGTRALTCPMCRTKLGHRHRPDDRV